MDPITITGFAISAIDVAIRTTSALIQYASDTRNATTHRRILANEAGALKAILQLIRDRLNSPSLEPNWLQSRQEVLAQFQAAYDDLAKVLKLDTSGAPQPHNRMKAIMLAAGWSFTKSEVYALIERITRLQQHANTFLLNDQVVLLESIEKAQRKSKSSFIEIGLVEVADVLDTRKELRWKILNWLTPLQMNRVHQSIMEQAQKGSGEWFLCSKQFLEWKNGQERLLWCTGIPGAGKTFLAALVAEHLQKLRTETSDPTEPGIAIVFLNYDERRQQTLENLLASIVKQLTQEEEELPDDLCQLYEQNGDPNIPPSLTNITSQLQLTVDRLSTSFLVIDGLDECSDDVRWGLIEALTALSSNARLFISSRSQGGIDEELEAFRRVEITADDLDVKLFVHAQIQRNPHLRRLAAKHPNMGQEIEDGVVRTAQGMFLLARLHLHSLATAAALSVRHVRHKLETLPTTITGTYDRAMERITTQDAEYESIARKALAWITYALRPLSLKELQHALAQEADEVQFSEDMLIDGVSITSFCAGLIKIEPITEKVNLVHYTAKAYFEDHRDAFFPHFHEHIVVTCASYLSLPALRSVSLQSLVHRFPFACYAAEYLGDHARLHHEDALSPRALNSIYQLISHQEHRKSLIELLEHLDLIRAGFFSDLNKTSDANDSLGSKTSSVIESTQLSGTAVQVTALHLAASMGLAKVAAMVVTNMTNVDATDEAGRTALEIAMDRGFWEAAEFLVNHDAQVDLTTELGQSLFLSVVTRKWQTVAKIIAQKAQDSDARDFATLLITASFVGDSAVVEHLLPEFEDNVVNNSARHTALFVAVECSNAAMVELLLSHGVDVDCRDSTGQTSLHRATNNGAQQVIRVLLEKGATVDALNDEGLTPWSANVGSLQSEVLDMLLDAGADPNTRGHNGVSVLYNSAASGNIEVVRLMVKRGTDPSIRTIFDWAPLHWASEQGHIEIVKLLLEAGADVNPVSDQGVTPLDLALVAHQVTAVHLLIQAGGLEAAQISLSRSTVQEDLPHLNRPSLTGDSEEPSSPPYSLPHKQTKTSFSFDQPFGQRMTFGQFVYPSSPSTVKRDFHNDKIKPYQVSHMLDSPVSRISIRRSPILITMDQYPLPIEFFERTDVIYDVIRTTPDYQELELRAQSSTLLPGNIKMDRTWSGCWKILQMVEDHPQLLFCVSPDWLMSAKKGSRWVNKDGKLVARTGGACEAIIYFDTNLDLGDLDALISCYIAKTWSDTVTKHKGILEWNSDDILVR